MTGAASTGSTAPATSNVANVARDEEEKLYVKVPTFDGTKKQWPYFKMKMRSYVAQKDMTELLTYSGDIPKDGDALDPSEISLAD